MASISRVLVANRGEIAVRVIRACREMGIYSILAASEADKDSLPAKMADRVVCIGPPSPEDSYLKIETVITAALGTGADAVHPGYGFLAERPELAEECHRHGIRFIGPEADAIRRMGNKLLARGIVKKLGIAVVPGSEKVGSFREALETAEELGFPVLLKSAAGGGGRGMRVAAGESELRAGFVSAANESRASFGDDTLFLERFIPNARHLEVQILADLFGNVIHLGERDCSLQRRYQKIVEEAPASFVSPGIRDGIREAAVRVAASLRYRGAGTIEFIFDQDRCEFYFLEMNTRIQVEHPVTEVITGVDIVKEQIRLADDHPLGLAQGQISFSGHAIECRVNAESPGSGFRPCPGKITAWRLPGGDNVRVDTHGYAGYAAPPYYDSLLAKVIVRGPDRPAAIEKMRRSLDEFTIGGVDTSIPFLQFILDHPDYRSGGVNTRWVESLAFGGPAS